MSKENFEEVIGRSLDVRQKYHKRIDGTRDLI